MSWLDNWTWPKTVAFAVLLLVILAVMRPDALNPLKLVSTAVLDGLQGLIPQ